MKEYVLGIDMGTSSVKVGLFDLKGEPIAFADETYRPVSYTHLDVYKRQAYNPASATRLRAGTTKT